MNSIPHNPFNDPLLLGGKVKLTEADKERADMIQAAKEFESVLLTRLMSEMKNTIGEWGMDKDNSTKQIQGIFWSHLAEEMGNQGGIGVWRQMVEALESNTGSETKTQLDTAL